MEKQRTGVTRADVHHQRRALAQGWQMLDTAAGFQIDQAGHLAVVNHRDRQAAGNADPVEHRFMIGGFMQHIRRHRAAEIVGIEPEFGEVLLVTANDRNNPLGGRIGNHVTAEHVVRKRRGLLEEIHRRKGSVRRTLGNHHGNGARSNMQRGDERRRIKRR